MITVETQGGSCNGVTVFVWDQVSWILERWWKNEEGRDTHSITTLM